MRSRNAGMWAGIPDRPRLRFSTQRLRIEFEDLPAIRIDAHLARGPIVPLRRRRRKTRGLLNRMAGRHAVGQYAHRPAARRIEFRREQISDGERRRAGSFYKQCNLETVIGTAVCFRKAVNAMAARSRSEKIGQKRDGAQ